MSQFKGGYYFAILELFEIYKEAYHGKELFELFENKFGSGSYINFIKALRKLIKSGKVKAEKGKSYNRVYYSKIS